MNYKLYKIECGQIFLALVFEQFQICTIKKKYSNSRTEEHAVILKKKLLTDFTFTISLWIKQTQLPLEIIKQKLAPY